MDLSLPRMDGWEATRRLKADERTRHIPIVALTGHALAGHAGGRAPGRLRRVRHQAVPARTLWWRKSSACSSAQSESVRAESRARSRRRTKRLSPSQATFDGDGQDDREEVKRRRPRPKAKRGERRAPARERAGRRRRAARGKLERVRMPAQAAEAGRADVGRRRGPNEGKYVYCIIKSERAARASGRSASAPSRPTSTRCTTRTSPRSSRTRRWRCTIRRARTCWRTSASTRR